MMGRALGLKSLGNNAIKQKPAKKSYFLRDVFTEVMIPDKNIAGSTQAGKRRKRRWGIVTMTVGILLAAATVGATTVSFFRNRSLIQSSVELADKSRVVEREDAREDIKTLRAIDQLGQRLGTIERYADEGPPLSYQLGYYQEKRSSQICAKFTSNGCGVFLWIAQAKNSKRH